MRLVAALLVVLPALADAGQLLGRDVYSSMAAAKTAIENAERHKAAAADARTKPATPRKEPTVGELVEALKRREKGMREAERRLERARLARELR